jgi:hypothetical protein
MDRVFAQVARCAAPCSSSIFVLFEGPWIISQPNGNTGLQATTFGKLDGMASSTHSCPVGMGSPGSYDLGTFTDTSGMKLPLELGAGETWAITVDPKYSRTPTQMTTLFDVPYMQDPFVYAKGAKGATVIDPNHDNRTVNLPIPDAVYVGGSLAKSTVGDPNKVLAPIGGNPPPAQMYAVVILEYQTTNTTPPNPLVLTPQGRVPIDLVAGNHVVFRMTHEDAMTAITHVTLALETLTNRIIYADPLNGTIPLQLTLTGSVTQYAGPGNNPDGFDLKEMGLMTPPPTPLPTPPSGGIAVGITSAAGFADCCGGGVVIGG